MALPGAMQPPRQWRPLAGLVLGALLCRWPAPSFSGLTPAAARQRTGSAGRGSSAVVRRAEGTILRRDPFLNEKMQKYIRQMMRASKREQGVREQESNEVLVQRKIAYLMKMGLKAKAEAMKAALEKGTAAWHENHMKVGDVFQGSFTHPDVLGAGRPVDIRLTVESETGGTWTSVKGDFEGTFTLDQDPPIIHEKGPKRSMSQATYIFNKFNRQWRDFSQPQPTAEEVQFLPLDGVQEFFFQVTEEKNFPPKDEFIAAAPTNPVKGMTKDEFIKYCLADDENYLNDCWKGVFTGRRIKIFDEELEFDGDFQLEADGVIIGFANFKGAGGGSFKLKLDKTGA